jgi:leader peptidase (prepilin peptidase)/N-methyltransferase
VRAEALLWFGQAFAVLYGLVIGSFLNVCIVRLPEDRSLWPRSACPSCNTPIAWYDNVPVLSWLILRGRCRHCGARISPLYPLVELLSGLLGWLLFRRIFADPADLDLAHIAAWVVQFGFLGLLVVAAYVDVRHRIIPDETSIYAVPFGIAGAALLQLVGYDGWMSIGWRQAVVGATLWWLAFAALSWVALYLMDQVALGWGDVKLAAMFGAFLGPTGTFAVLMFGSIIASTVGIVVTVAQGRRTYLPYGPPLALAAVLYVLWGEPFLTAVFPHMLGP